MFTLLIASLVLAVAFTVGSMVRDRALARAARAACDEGPENALQATQAGPMGPGAYTLLTAGQPKPYIAGRRIVEPTPVEPIPYQDLRCLSEAQQCVESLTGRPLMPYMHATVARTVAREPFDPTRTVCDPGMVQRMAYVRWSDPSAVEARINDSAKRILRSLDPRYVKGTL